MASDMTKDKQVKTTSFPAHRKAKHAFDTVVTALTGTDIEYKGGPVTKEAVFNALWLWVGSMEPALVERAMARFVPYFEAVMRGEPAELPAAFEASDAPLAPTTKAITKVGGKPVPNYAERKAQAAAAKAAEAAARRKQKGAV